MHIDVTTWVAANGSGIWVLPGSDENEIAGNVFEDIAGAAVFIQGDSTRVRLRRAVDVDDHGAVDAGRVGTHAERVVDVRAGVPSATGRSVSLPAALIGTISQMRATSAAAVFVDDEVVVPDSVRSEVRVCRGRWRKTLLRAPKDQKKRPSGAVPGPGRTAATTIAGREMLPVERSCYFGNTEY